MIVDEIIESKLLINGEARDASTGETAELTSPATGETIARYPLASTEDVDAAVESVHHGFRSWSALTAYDREKTIRTATAQVRQRADEIGRLMALEQGKPLTQSRGEIVASCDTLDYFASEGVRLEGTVNPTEKAGLRSWVIYQPVGVCAFITPWNYPVSLLSWKLGPALATGCTAVVKPTSVTPLSPTAFCRALVDAGIPADALAVVTGRGSVVGEALIRHRKVRKVAMTGSTATGKRLMEVYAPTLNRISLELGGHCPAVVCADADIVLAAKIIAYKGFRNMGQSCSSVNRVYAHESVIDDLTDELVRLAEAHSIGDGVTEPDVDLGPMATADGLETVKAHIEDAVDRGARLICGGKAPDGEKYASGNYFLPTVLRDPAPGSRVLCEETFGPVVPIAPFTDLDDAIARANDTDYGLVSYAFTRDYATTVRLSEELEAGTVCINNGAVNTNYAPYAGWKASGYGLELSRKAVFEYVNTKHVKTQV